MDDFNSSLKNGFDHQSELPEDFGWNDMREGIYEKMQTTKPKKNNRSWYLLLLLLLIVGGAGGWFVLEYLNKDKSITNANAIVSIQEHEKEINTNSRNIQPKTNNSQQNTKPHSTNDMLPQSKQKHKKIVDKKKKLTKLLRTNTTQSNTKTPKNTINYIAEKGKEIKKNKSTIPNNPAINPSQKNETSNHLILLPSKLKRILKQPLSERIYHLDLQEASSIGLLLMPPTSIMIMLAAFPATI